MTMMTTMLTMEEKTGIHTIPPLLDENRSSAIITIELPRGYPTTATLQMVSYREVLPSSSARTKPYLEEAIRSIRSTTLEALDPYGDGSMGVGEECAVACCTAAIDSWRGSGRALEQPLVDSSVPPAAVGGVSVNDGFDIRWVTANCTLVDRKSVFRRMFVG